jgi:hypothetical protein
MIKEAKKGLKNFSKEVVKSRTFKILEDIISILILMKFLIRILKEVNLNQILFSKIQKYLKLR